MSLVSPIRAPLPSPSEMIPRRARGTAPNRPVAVVAGAPAAVAFLLSIAWSWNPSFWMDETASLSAARRSLPDLLRLLGTVDAVHGLYYAALHVWVGWFGASEFAVRFPSALGAAFSAAALALLGRHLAGNRAGLFAGVVYALLPVTSFYGMDTRAYSWVAGLACLATFCLLRALDTRRIGWFAAYAGSIALLGWVFLLGVALLAAHAVVVARHAWLHRDLRTALAWPAAALGGMALLVPLILLSIRERGQLAWALSPTFRDLLSYPVVLWFGRAAAVGVLFWAAIAWSVVRARRARRARGPEGPLTGRVLLVGLSWLVAPVLALFTVSLSTPLMARRYVVYCVAGGCLVVGALLASIPSRWAAAAVVLVVLAALPTWVANRGTTGQGSTNRLVAQVIHDHARPGDAVVYLTHSRRGIDIAYPRLLAGVADVELGGSPASTATLWGRDLPTARTARRLATRHRVWVVNAQGLANPDDGRPGRLRALLGSRFHLEARWGGADTEAVTLYTAP